jgi:hypothetical protein
VRIALPVALAAAALLASGAARAQLPPPVHLELDYRVAPGLEKSCVDARGLVDLAYVELQYDPFRPPFADGHLVVEVTSVDGEVEVAWENAPPSPSVQPGRYKTRRRRCVDAIHDALAALKDALPPPPSPPPPAVAAPPAAPPAPPPVLVVAAPPDPPAPSPPPVAEPRRWHPQLGVSAGVRLGTGPAPAPGLAFDAGIRWAPLSISVEARLALPTGIDVPNRPGARASNRLYTGALVPCGHLRFFFGCALVEVGASQVSSEGVSAQGRTVGPYAAGGVRVGAQIPLGDESFSVRLAGEITGVGTPARISVTEVPRDVVVWTMPVVNGAFSGGVVARF